MIEISCEHCSNYLTKGSIEHVEQIDGGLFERGEYFQDEIPVRCQTGQGNVDLCFQQWIHEQFLFAGIVLNVKATICSDLSVA